MSMKPYDDNDDDDDGDDNPPTHGAFEKFKSLSVKSSSDSKRLTSQLTSKIAETYRRCNPSQFKYRKCLTKNSRKSNNQDNKDGHLIIYEGDVIRVPDRSYRIESLLGTGVFAQVVECTCSQTGQSVALKIIKNKSEYFNQAVMEVRVLQQLNLNYRRNENIVSMLSSFMYVSVRAPIVYHSLMEHHRTPGTRIISV